jgi:hypothetical protein
VGRPGSSRIPAFFFGGTSPGTPALTAIRPATKLRFQPVFAASHHTGESTDGARKELSQAADI